MVVRLARGKSLQRSVVRENHEVALATDFAVATEAPTLRTTPVAPELSLIYRAGEAVELIGQLIGEHDVDRVATHPDRLERALLRDVVRTELRGDFHHPVIPHVFRCASDKRMFPRCRLQPPDGIAEDDVAVGAVLGVDLPLFTSGDRLPARGIDDEPVLLARVSERRPPLHLAQVDAFPHRDDDVGGEVSGQQGQVPVGRHCSLLGSGLHRCIPGLRIPLVC